VDGGRKSRFAEMQIGFFVYIRQPSTVCRQPFTVSYRK